MVERRVKLLAQCGIHLQHNNSSIQHVSRTLLWEVCQWLHIINYIDLLVMLKKITRLIVISTFQQRIHNAHILCYHSNTYTNNNE